MDLIDLDRHDFNYRPKTLWRYIELLPIIDPTNIVDLKVGFTPLHECKRLGEVLGLKKLYVKDDTINPTGSFKD
ncbi:TPA: pyridoxal-phosphate dependent enzyme, partial [Candidatus Bathyarchaeota archaeon]|nr:pyridoxal-phosphate dependent enzyme [Candidatus Bathyarchaeota archaeon]